MLLKLNKNEKRKSEAVEMGFFKSTAEYILINKKKEVNFKVA